MLSFLSSTIWGSSQSQQPIPLPPVETHNVETAAERRPRTLKHLLKANHANHSIIYHNLRFHNHCPHILGSAYIYGATPEHMTAIYDKEADELEPWHDSPAEITQDDWRDFLGQRNYQRAYVDFFEDQLVKYGYDWRKLVHHYMFEGEKPLVNSLISGLAHPLIHLGYALELSSRTVAIEALALATCFYSFLHKYLDDPSYTKASTFKTDSPLNILQRVAADSRFDGLFDGPGLGNMDVLFQKHEAELLEYWNAWDLSNPGEQFEQSQRAAVALLVATHNHQDQKYDFFLVHLLTSSHAVRILLPLVPAKFQISLVRQWWLFTLAVYISQTRPEIKLERITDYDVAGRDWKFVQNGALNSRWALDAHYVKATRAMKEAAQTWGDDSQFFLKAALKFSEEFNSWGGFDALGASDVN
ncbi:hypothetical protein BDY21DRAFT_337173 [Lineolata rhizophorae]|uniref:MGS207 protein n=1 Tax=Lineolata rhizophorae TaxID=578093 RepID=A0A6A6P7N0_9PEZI|nr:hypothetical protein BDY21DRAFT_337173 [Lineolata rhizophorae]